MGDWDNCQLQIEFGQVPQGERQARVDPADPRSSFYRVRHLVGSIRPILDAAYEALARQNHQITQSFALHGPCGETASALAEAVGLPFVRINTVLVETPNDLLADIAKVLENTVALSPDGPRTLELHPGQPTDGRFFPLWNFFRVPPCVVFIDEMGLLAPQVRQALVNALAAEDHLFATGCYLADIECVCWVLASGERDQLGNLPRWITFLEVSR